MILIIEKQNGTEISTFVCYFHRFVISSHSRSEYFIFETPFTSTGKPHGDLSVQCKRKTIVEVENSFPYTKKRLAVIGKKEIILEPIENAIEIIQSREKALRRELDLSPPNIKTLQINLQGAVLARSFCIMHNIIALH